METLSLLMLGSLFAVDIPDLASLHYVAVLAHLLYGRSHLHDVKLTVDVDNLTGVSFAGIFKEHCS